VNSVWTYFTDNRDQIGHWTVTTIWLAGLPLLIGLAVALPIGWVASRYRWSYLPVVSGFGLLYTVPSIVLILVLPGILGTKILDPVNVAISLSIYTIALLVRTVADGLASVSAETLAAASAMGHTGLQRLFRVQLPIAVPVIGAGLRVAAVSNVSLVSIASIIGVSQLGELFITANNDGLIAPAVVGLVLFVLLAAIFDLLIVLGIRVLTPWQRAVSAR
jgi:osmoprotectant transport system permease protein